MVIALFVVPRCPSWALEKSKYPTGVTTLADDHGFFTAHSDSLFWQVIPFYVSQETGWSCSVAASATALNGLKSILKAPLTQSDTLFTESNLLADPHEAWNRKSGVSLQELTGILKTIVINKKLPIRVDMHLASKTDRNFFKEVLIASEKKEKIVIVNFLQSAMTQDAKIGHFAAIGAYDATTDRVLVLDPDREYYAPYWGSLDALWDGLKTIDPTTHMTRGFIALTLEQNLETKKPN